MYDFSKRPLKVHEYTTLEDYVNKHSFNANGIVLYLCYHDNELVKVVPPPAPVIPPYVEERPVLKVEVIEVFDDPPETADHGFRT